MHQKLFVTQKTRKKSEWIWQAPRTTHYTHLLMKISNLYFSDFIVCGTSHTRSWKWICEKQSNKFGELKELLSEALRQLGKDALPVQEGVTYLCARMVRSEWFRYGFRLAHKHWMVVLPSSYREGTWLRARVKMQLQMNFKFFLPQSSIVNNYFYNVERQIVTD